MQCQTRYINTDLELKSSRSLSVLCSEFDCHDCFVVHHERDEAGIWFAIIESPSVENQSAADDIWAMLAILSVLTAEAQAQWEGCYYRDFNVGFDVGETGTYRCALAADTVCAVADAGCSLSLTLYPVQEAETLSP